MAALELTFLGTGTSTGIPVIGCDCAVCHSQDPRDNRLRASVYLRTPQMGWVVDTGPDFRTQCLRAGIRHVDAVLITHPHTDHIMGFDDLRRFTFEAEQYLPVYAAPPTLQALGRVYEFAFSGENRFPGYLKPAPRPVTGPFALGDTAVQPLPVVHGRVETQGYLFAAPGAPTVAYIPDCKSIPEPTLELLTGVGVLIIDCLRHEPHPTHLTVSESLAVVKRVRPGHTWFTHISHDLGHAAFASDLPENISVAWDGLVLKWP